MLYRIAGFTLTDQVVAAGVAYANTCAGEKGTLTTFTSEEAAQQEDAWADLMRQGYKRFGVVWERGEIQHALPVTVQIDSEAVYEKTFVKTVSMNRAYGYVYAKSMAEAVLWAEGYWDETKEEVRD